MFTQAPDRTAPEQAGADGFDGVPPLLDEARHALELGAQDRAAPLTRDGDGREVTDIDLDLAEGRGEHHRRDRVRLHEVLFRVGVRQPRAEAPVVDVHQAGLGGLLGWIYVVLAPPAFLAEVDPTPFLGVADVIPRGALELHIVTGDPWAAPF